MKTVENQTEEITKKMKYVSKEDQSESKENPTDLWTMQC